MLEETKGILLPIIGFALALGVFAFFEWTNLPASFAIVYFLVIAGVVHMTSKLLGIDLGVKPSKEREKIEKTFVDKILDNAVFQVFFLGIDGIIIGGFIGNYVGGSIGAVIGGIIGFCAICVLVIVDKQGQRTSV